MYYLHVTDNRTGWHITYAWREEIMRRAMVRYFSLHAHFTFVTWQATQY